MTVKVSKIEDELEAIHHDLWLDGTEDLISKRTREVKTSKVPLQVCAGSASYAYM